MTDRQAKVNAVAECYLVTGDEQHVRRMSADQNLSEDVVAEGIALARADKGEEIVLGVGGVVLSIGVDIRSVSPCVDCGKITHREGTGSMYGKALCESCAQIRLDQQFAH